MRDFSLQTSWTQVQHSTQHTCEEPLHLRVLCIGCRDKQISKRWDLLGPTALMRKEAVLLYTIQYCTKHTCEDSPYTSLSGESIVCQRLGYISQRCHPEPEKTLQRVSIAARKVWKLNRFCGNCHKNLCVFVAKLVTDNKPFLFKLSSAKLDGNFCKVLRN